MNNKKEVFKKCLSNINEAIEQVYHSVRIIAMSVVTGNLGRILLVNI